MHIACKMALIPPTRKVDMPSYQLGAALKVSIVNTFYLFTASINDQYVYLYTASINYKGKISQQVLPLHVALHPHLVREVPHQHHHHPQTGNSPTNPVKSIV